MRASLAILLVLAATACKQSAPESQSAMPTKETAAGARMIDYAPPKKSFTCLAPADWGVKEEQSEVRGEVVVFESGQSRILIVKNPGPGYKTAEAYANSFWEVDPEGKQPPVEKKIIDGRPVFRLDRIQAVKKVHSNKFMYNKREHHAFIQSGTNYYQILHTAPADSFEATLPVFESVLRSFQPNS